MNISVKTLVTCLFITVCSLAISVSAEDSTDIPAEDNPFANLDWKVGPTTARVGNVAEQRVDNGYIFLEAADARKFLELNENPSDGSEEGVIVSEEWWACYSYNDIGYVSDDEKSELDKDALLDSIKENLKASNAERRRRGWQELTLLGWACEPHYDESTHNLEWGLKFSSAEEVTVNYNTKILGRGGVMSVTLVCDPDAFESVLPQFKAALNGFSYTSGHRYFEFRPGDRTAEIGLSALIVGGATAAAVKSGAFKWLWKALVAVAAAIGGLLKKIFGRGGKKNE